MNIISLSPNYIPSDTLRVYKNVTDIDTLMEIMELYNVDKIDFVINSISEDVKKYIIENFIFSKLFVFE